jgi:hypothetical protein
VVTMSTCIPLPRSRTDTVHCVYASLVSCRIAKTKQAAAAGAAVTKGVATGMQVGSTYGVFLSSSCWAVL